MKKVSLPLKWKIISTNVALLLLTIFLFVRFASTLFNEDKSASIYESTLESSLSLADRLNVYFKSNRDSFSLLQRVSGQQNFSGNLLKDVFKRNTHLISYSHYREDSKLVVSLENEVFLKTNELDARFFNHKFFKDKMQPSQSWQLVSIPNGSEILLLAQKLESELFVAYYSLEGAIKKLSSQRQFRHYIFIGDKLLQSDNSKNPLLERELIRLKSSVLKNSDEAKVLKTVSSQESYLLAASPVGTQSLAISAVSEGLIYRASRFLRQQSLYFSLLIFAITVFLGVLLSRRMTSDLAKLHDASLAFAQGNFEEDFNVVSRDEIGSLAVTFKKMGRDILAFIEEMKDKARLDSEMEVARLVQESFIPQGTRSHHSLKISSYYQAASECGGDWWGSFEVGTKSVVVVADATGHGVPAALLTATASGCLHQLEYECQQGKRAELKPSDILDVFNYSITKMGGKIHMTAFALVLDCVSGEGLYSNASHNSPLSIASVLNSDHRDITKEDLNPLMQGIGPRLGQAIDSKYEDISLKLNRGDFLLLFSDGLVEQQDGSQKAWGNRRFYKEVVSFLNEHKSLTGLSLLAEHLVGCVQGFSGKLEWDDDITIVSLGFSDGDMASSADIPPIFNDETKVLISSESNDKIYGEYLESFPFKAVISDNNQRGYYDQVVNEGIVLESLFGPLIHNEVLVVDSPKSIDSLIDEASLKFDYKGYFSSPKGPFCLLTKEIVTNAIYHQQAETSGMDRSQNLSLPYAKRVEVELFQSEKGIGVLVQDCSGRLTYEDFRQSLLRAFQQKRPAQKQGGAGLGLYLVFQHANKVFIDTEKGKWTKVVAFIEKEKRYKNYKSKTTNFYFNERLS